MTHEEFIENLKREFDRGKRSPKSAADALVNIAEQAIAERDTPGVWHAQQSLGLAGLLYEKAGHRARAARLFEQVAQLAEDEVTYHSRAAASARAQASRLWFLSGKNSAGVANAESALRFLGSRPEPGAIFEEMMTAYREYHVARDRRRRMRKK